MRLTCQKRIIISSISIFFFILVINLFSCTNPVNSQNSKHQGDRAEILRVIDGDTLMVRLEGTKDRVRLIGVDTPEVFHSKKLARDARASARDRKVIQALGREASRFVRSLAKPGDSIRLEYDREKRDRYGRLLAYVYLSDGTFLNAEIIRRGYGQAYTRFPFKYLEEFRALEREACEKRRGLWD
jgi:micrococcal nuclease